MANKNRAKGPAVAKRRPKARAVVRQPNPQKLQKPVNGLSRAAAEYLASILQPCAGSARIPDLNCVPTFLTTLTTELSMNTNPQGICGIQFNPSSNPSYAFESSASTDAVIAYNASIFLPGAAAMAAAASRVRLVSACLDVIYTGNTQIDGGILTGMSVTAFGGVLEPYQNTLSSFQNSRSNTTVRAKDGLAVFYRPGDSTSFDFQPTTAATSWGVLNIHLSGLSVSPLAPFMLKLTANYECIPANDTNSFSAGVKSSPVDLSGLGHVVTHVQSAPAQTTRTAAAGLTSILKPVLTGAMEYGPAIWRAMQTARAGAGLLA